MSKGRIEWLDRSLITGPYLTLCLTPKQYVVAMKDLEVKANPKEWLKNNRCNATVHVLESRGGLACIVCIEVKKRHSIEQVSGLLTHEAVHIWQVFRRDIGEDEPSDEFEAYAIQTISQRLFESYREQWK